MDDLWVSYEDTKNDESLRQKYIDQRFNDDLPDFISGIVYDSDNSKAIKHLEDLLSNGFVDEERINGIKVELESNQLVSRHLMRIFLSSDIFGKKIKQPIFVTKKAFANYNETEFRKALCEHEFVHGKDLFYGIQIGNVLVNYKNSHLLQQDTINAVFDLRALHNQMLECVIKGEEPDGIFLQAMSGFVIYYQILKDVKPKSELETYVRNNQLEFYWNFMIPKMRVNLRN